MSMRRPVSLAALAVMAGALHATAQAHPTPRPQRQLSRGAVDLARPTPPPPVRHDIFGTIASVRGSALLLRTRTGKLLAVDAAPAIAAGTYSAPLFVGKIVLVGGTLDAARTLHAQTIVRIERLDARTGPDR
jgi:hypothetical protein